MLRRYNVRVASRYFKGPELLVDLQVCVCTRTCAVCVLVCVLCVCVCGGGVGWCKLSSVCPLQESVY